MAGPGAERGGVGSWLTGHGARGVSRAPPWKGACMEMWGGLRQTTQRADVMPVTTERTPWAWGNAPVALQRALFSHLFI